MKKKIFVIVTTGILILAGAGWYFYDNLEKYVYPTLIPPAGFWVDTEKPLHEQTGRIEIAGRVFDIPLMYISGRLHAAQEDHSVVLRYLLPNFKTKLELTELEYRKALKDGQSAGMLLEESAIRPSFNKMIENRKRNLAKVEATETFDVFVKEKWYRKQQDKLIFYYEVYLEKDKQGNIQSFIECATQDRPGTRSPTCSHKFRDKGLLYKIHYNKKNYLSSWREQRRKAIAFIDSFEITPNNLNHEGMS